MSFISVKHLNKEFKVLQRDSGLRNAFKSLIKRRYKTIKAVDDISLEIEKGEIVGYIGPNGAGKSTTIKMLCGILKADSGTIRVAGFDPFKDRKQYVKNIGVVFGQKSQLWWDIPVIDSFELLKSIYKISDKDYNETKKELVELLDLEDILTIPVRQLSLGQRMRAELCGSLLHRPQLLFLDEPTIGLDAVSKLALRDFLKWENDEYGTTIMLTTHDMEDIEALCSRVMVLGHGKKLFDGKLQDLLERYDTVRNVKIKYDQTATNLRLPEGVNCNQTEDGIELSYNPAEFPTSKLLALLQEAGNISELTLQPQNTDHMIAAMYKELDL